MAYITPDDLKASLHDYDDTRLQELIDDATAFAIGAGPCLADESNLTANQVAEVKAIMRAAIKRFAKSGEQPNKTWESAGMFAQGFAASTSMFDRAELTRFREICDDVSGVGSGSFTFSIVPLDEDGNR